MIKTTKLPKEFIGKAKGLTYAFGIAHMFNPEVEKCTLEGIDEIQYLSIAPWTSIKMHGHELQWEVWVRISHKTAHICLIGEEHELENNSDITMNVLAIKGNMNYSYDDLAEFFKKLGFSVAHGSLVIND